MFSGIQYNSCHIVDDIKGVLTNFLYNVFFDRLFSISYNFVHELGREIFYLVNQKIHT